MGQWCNWAAALAFNPSQNLPGCPLPGSDDLSEDCYPSSNEMILEGLHSVLSFSLIFSLYCNQEPCWTAGKMFCPFCRLAFVAAQSTLLPKGVLQKQRRQEFCQSSLKHWWQVIPSEGFARMHAEAWAIVSAALVSFGRKASSIDFSNN